MQKYINVNALDRVKSALSSDKHYKPNEFSEVIKAEIYGILKEYADIKTDDFEVSIVINEFGEYDISIHAIARRLKMVGIVPVKNNL